MRRVLCLMSVLCSALPGAYASTDLMSGQSVVVTCQGSDQPSRDEIREEAVDTICFQQQMADFTRHWSPTPERFYEWAKACQTTVDVGRCRLMQESMDTECYSTVSKSYSKYYQPSVDTPERIRKACARRRFRCQI